MIVVYKNKIKNKITKLQLCNKTLVDPQLCAKLSCDHMKMHLSTIAQCCRKCQHLMKYSFFS